MNSKQSDTILDYIADVRQKVILGNKSLEILINTDSSYTNENLLNMADDLYNMYDYKSLTSGKKLELFIKSALFKFLRFKLIIDELNNKIESELVMTQSKVLELICQLQYLGFIEALNFVLDNYLKILRDNLLCYDEDLFSIIEFELLKGDQRFSSYLKLNNKYSKSSIKNNLDLVLFNHDYSDELFIVLYYRLLASENKGENTPEIFYSLNYVLINIDNVLHDISLSIIVKHINRKCDISTFFYK